MAAIFLTISNSNIIFGKINKCNKEIKYNKINNDHDDDDITEIKKIGESNNGILRITQAFINCYYILLYILYISIE